MWASVYSIWSDITSRAWKRCEDEVKSAKVLMEEAHKNNWEKSGLYSTKPIPLAQEDSVTAIAFALPNLLCQFGGHMQELALDSACKQSDSRPIIN
jgi:hypothetical protein